MWGGNIILFRITHMTNYYLLSLKIAISKWFVLYIWFIYVIEKVFFFLQFCCQILWKILKLQKFGYKIQSFDIIDLKSTLFGNPISQRIFFSVLSCTYKFFFSIALSSFTASWKKDILGILLFWIIKKYLTYLCRITYFIEIEV